MYRYCVNSENNTKKFKETCSIIEKAYPKAKKNKLLIDVDGSTIQTYTEDGKDIDIYDDYDIGSVYVQSEIDLGAIFEWKHLQK